MTLLKANSQWSESILKTNTVLNNENILFVLKKFYFSR